MVVRLDADDPVEVEEAVRQLAAGMVVAIPTDTVYGLAVDPRQPEGVDRIFALKRRPGEVALPMLVAGRNQVEVVAGLLEPAAQGLADRFWPGPLTLVVPRAVGFDADLGGPPEAQGTVGVRWPDHPVVRALCTAVGPLAVTSANRHGKPPATLAQEVIAVFSVDDRLSAVVDGGVCDGVPSTVVACRGEEVWCLRRGGIPWSGPMQPPEALG
ncbi:MAG TPA: L-threonylcarbamoyladenylate synthase [Acidimicrobiales bacterium]|jgi:L-threonylcarbamoyladenylate synthase|nr:L-threonylcarbamoyladenylate synthase [Acidimicrobiales bacterium]